MTPPADVNDVSELSAEQLASILRFHTREGQVFDHTNDTVVVTRTLLNKSADLIEQQQREIERLRDALKKIAAQELSEELDEDEREHADYEGAYDKIISLGRAALTGTARRSEMSIPDHCWADHDGQSRILDPAAVEKEFTRIHNEAIEQAAKVADDEENRLNDIASRENYALAHGIIAARAKAVKKIAAAIRSLKLPEVK